MKRLWRSSTGKLSYGPKWQTNTEATNEITTDGGCSSAAAELTEIVQVSSSDQSGVVQPRVPGQPEEDNTRKGNDLHRSMYRAALQGNWEAAEALVRQDKSLAFDKITIRGDRASHVATAMGHKDFLERLVQCMEQSQLQDLQDGHGYTACCYAALSDVVEIADVMRARVPNIFTTARDKNNMTPIHKAVSLSKRKMVLYLLKLIQLKDLTKKEWFDLLLEAIRRGLYDVATIILVKDVSLAKMTNQQGTALHLLARKSDYPFLFRDPERRPLIIRDVDPKKAGYWLLTRLLWSEIQRMRETYVIELMTKPLLIHEAAKVENMRLIRILTCTYPDLLWESDDKGYTIIHIAVLYRKELVFTYIRDMKAMKDSITTSQDENGNNILHLVAMLNPHNKCETAFQMQEDLVWFEGVKAIVPPSCLEMRNNYGLTPGELFSMEHESLLEKSEIWVRNTADTCMLIATLMFTVAFTASITILGGSNQDTGVPILLESRWYRIYTGSASAVLFTSMLSMVSFWNVITSTFEQDKFVEIMNRLAAGLMLLLMSLVCSILTSTCAYGLLVSRNNTGYFKISPLIPYVMVISVIFFRFTKVMAKLPVAMSFHFALANNYSRLQRATRLLKAVRRIMI